MAYIEYVYSILFEFLSLFVLVNSYNITLYYICFFIGFQISKDILIINYCKKRYEYKYKYINFSEEPPEKPKIQQTEEDRRKKFIQEINAWMKEHYPDYQSQIQTVETENLNKFNVNINQYEKTLSEYPDKEQIKEIVDQWNQVKMQIVDFFPTNIIIQRSQSKPKINDRLKEAINSHNEK